MNDGLSIVTMEDALNELLSCQTQLFGNGLVFIPPEFCLANGKCHTRPLVFSVISFKKNKQGIKIKARPLREDVRISRVIPTDTVFLTNMVEYVRWEDIDNVKSNRVGTVYFKYIKIAFPIGANRCGETIKIIL